MIGLLYKEFYTLRRYITSYATALVMFIVLSVLMKSAVYLQSMLAMSLGMLTLTGMSYDKMYGWDKMVLTMPLKRSQIVLSKYIANAVMGIVSMVISSGLGIVLLSIIPMEEDSLGIMVITGVLLFAVLLIIYAVILPLMYKFGVERTRIYMAGVVVLILVGLTTVMEYVPDTFFGYLEDHVVMSGAAFVSFACVCYILSYFISVGIYQKKEF
ncbi:MAG: ABC-2 transporter permease [Lachnospiraceae bacterium]|nr:ABC-2 transporter permease [Lachnospiraceae bacterium]